MFIKKKYSFVFGFLLLFFGIGVPVYAIERDTSLTKKYFDRGIDCYNNFNFDSSLFYYNLAKERYQKEKNWLLYIYCLTNSGKVYENYNNFSKANEIFDKAEKMSDSLLCNNTKVSTQEILYLKYVLAFIRRKFDKVVEYAEKYLKFKSIKYNISYVYYTLGYSYYFLQDYDNSNKAYFNAVKTIEKNCNDIIHLSKVYTAIATNYYLQSEYGNAILYHNKAIIILEINYKNRPELVRIYTALSMVYYVKEDYNKAIYYLNLAIKNGNEKYQLPYIFRSLGSCYEKLDDFVLAESNYLKALEYVKINASENNEKITILIFYGELCKRIKDKTKALRLFYQALSLSIQYYGLKDLSTSNCYSTLADFYLSEKNYKKAIQNYQSALIALNPLFYSMDIYTNPSIGEIISYGQYFNILKNKADALREYYKITHLQKDLDMSLKTYELLCHEMEQQRSGFMTKDDKSFITEKYYSIYSAALQTAMQLYGITHNDNYKERALKLAEQNKSAFLLEQFNENNAKNFAGLPTIIREKEKVLRRSIANSEKMIYEESLKKNMNPKTKAYWESCLFESRNASDTLSVYIKNNFSAYHRLKYNPSGISSGEIQKSLSPESALIEYSLADTILYIFIITKESFEVIVRKSLSNQEIEKFNQCFNISQIEFGGIKSFKNYIHASFRIYEKLLKPVEAFFKSKKELIIIPDDKLALIPFEALISTDKISNISYKHLPYLIKKYNIGYAQLATLLIKPKSHSSDKPLLLAVAPEYGSSVFKAQQEIKKLHSGGYNLDPIPGVLEEVKFLKQIEGTKILFSGEATEGAFKKSQRRFNILHLAMHAVVDYKNPMYSKLIFSKSDEKGEDGFLNMYELMNMDVNADMTVLSACNTGTGNFLKGEGIMNLARGFFYAGCQSVVMTLWAVDDNSSSKLIKNFYSYFTEGKSKTEALRLAKLDFLENANSRKEHPYFWAGYVIIGDTSPLYHEKNTKIILIVTGIILLILLCFILLRKLRLSKRKNRNMVHQSYHL